MRFVLAMSMLFQGFLFASVTDFDVVIVGTSPRLMLEAIYHISSNERVLILEEDEQCGGAWKSIDICGISNVDLGCHLIGSDQQIKEFFETYFGCRFVCLDHPFQLAVNEHAKCPKGFYFSRGCYELISKLKGAIDAAANTLLLHQKLESIYINPVHDLIELTLGDLHLTTAKLIITPVSHFQVENPSYTNQEYPLHPHHHLYLLVEDPTPSRFTYLSGIAKGMSRAMNLTPFLEMPREGLQLIAIQTHGKNEFEQGGKFLEAFKSKELLHPNARIVASDTYTYYQTNANYAPLLKIGGPLIELIDANSFGGMASYLAKWKTAMVPLRTVN